MYEAEKSLYGTSDIPPTYNSKYVFKDGPQSDLFQTEAAGVEAVTELMQEGSSSTGGQGEQRCLDPAKMAKMTQRPMEVPHFQDEAAPVVKSDSELLSSDNAWKTRVAPDGARVHSTAPDTQLERQANTE